MNSDFPDIEGGSGAPVCKFDNVGDTHGGTIINIEKRPQVDFVTKQMKTYPDSGNPMFEYVFTLKLDNGEEGRIIARGQMWKAIKDARGSNPWKRGARLVVRHSGLEPAKIAGLSPQKIYLAKYELPVVIDDWDTPAPAAAPVTSESLI